VTDAQILHSVILVDAETTVAVVVADPAVGNFTGIETVFAV